MFSTVKNEFRSSCFYSFRLHLHQQQASILELCAAGQNPYMGSAERVFQVLHTDVRFAPSPDALFRCYSRDELFLMQAIYIYMLRLQIISRVLFSSGKNTGIGLSLIAFILQACFLFMQIYYIPKSIVVSSLQSQSCTAEDFIVSETNNSFHCNSLFCSCPPCLSSPNICCHRAFVALE